MANSVYDFSARTIDGEEMSLSTWRGKAMLIVNVASECRLTKQYAGLAALYNRFSERGLVILGFPCNQFLQQEPGSHAGIKLFCSQHYGVRFPLFEKIEVNGPGAHPLYEFLKDRRRGFLGTRAIKWNFTKFLVDREGQPVRRYAPTVAPEKLVVDIELALGGAGELRQAG